MRFVEKRLILTASVVGIIGAILAYILLSFAPTAPSLVNYSETSTTVEESATTTTEISETTETEPTTETTSVKLTEKTTQNFTRETSRAEIKTTTKVSKVVSRLEEMVEKDREWLSSRESTTASYTMSASDFKRAGVVYYGGYKFTYYSEKVLPGKGLNIPGRYSDGNFVRDENGYICVACKDLPKGTVIDTPFGKGKVYDVCRDSGVVDVYVSF